MSALMKAAGQFGRSMSRDVEVWIKMLMDHLSRINLMHAAVSIVTVELHIYICHTYVNLIISIKTMIFKWNTEIKQIKWNLCVTAVVLLSESVVLVTYPMVFTYVLFNKQSVS